MKGQQDPHPALWQICRGRMMFLVNPLCFNFVCDRVLLYVHRAVALISPHLNFLMETCTCPRPPLRTLSAYIPSLSSTSHPLATWCSHMTSGTKPTSSCRRSKVSQNSKTVKQIQFTSIGHNNCLDSTITVFSSCLQGSLTI